MKTEPCSKCLGSGKQISDRWVGQELRKKRKVMRLSLREMARRMGLSAPYMSDLELGRRHWSEEHYEQYLAALGQ